METLSTIHCSPPLSAQEAAILANTNTTIPPNEDPSSTTPNNQPTKPSKSVADVLCLTC